MDHYPPGKAYLYNQTLKYYFLMPVINKMAAYVKKLCKQPFVYPSGF